MSKKSGLADSPFFQPIAPTPLPPREETTKTVKPVASNVQANDRTSEQVNDRSDEHLNGRTYEQAINRSSAQVNDRSVEQQNDRTDERPERPVSRKSYDIYDDQAEAIEDLVYRWGKERKRYITKGQVMRELLDEIIPQKQK